MKKAHFFALLTLVTLLANSAWAEETRPQLEAWAKRSAQELWKTCATGNPKSYAKKYDELESLYMSKSARFGDSSIKRWVQDSVKRKQEPTFLDLGRELWPLVASPEIPLLKIYVPCGTLSDAIHEKLLASGLLETSALEEWESCVALAYRESMPPLTRALRSCLRSLAKPAPPAKSSDSR